MDNEIARSIGRLEGKVDGLTDLHTNQFKNIEVKFDSVFKLLQDHQTDINEEKIWRASIVGSAKILLLVGGAVWSFIVVVATTLLSKLLNSK